MVQKRTSREQNDNYSITFFDDYDGVSVISPAPHPHLLINLGGTIILWLGKNQGHRHSPGTIAWVVVIFFSEKISALKQP